MKPCRHCAAPQASYPRGLCYRCYYSPVRADYPPAPIKRREWPACPDCGERFDLSNNSVFCPLCQFPEPFRSERLARLNHYTALATAETALFGRRV